MRSLSRRKGLAAAAFVLLAAVATPTFAHGFGQRYDLPLPLTLWVWAAGLTIVISFVVVAAFVRERPAGAPSPRLDLLGVPGLRVLASPVLGDGVRALVAVLFVFTLVAGLIGVQDPARNLIVPMIWVIFWVGASFASALLGNIWPLINPLRTLFVYGEELLGSARGPRRSTPPRPYPAALGHWPAVVFFLGFAWSELVWLGNNTPALLAIEIIIYAVICWIGMAVYGREEWLEHADAFTVAFGVLARFAPFEIGAHSAVETYPAAFATETRKAAISLGAAAAPVSAAGLLSSTGDRNSVWNLRPPGAGLLDDQAVSWPFLVFVLTMLSTVTFDGFLETPLYQSLDDWVHAFALTANFLSALVALGIDDEAALKTVTLILFPCAFVLIFAAASWLMARATAGASQAGGRAARAGSITGDLARRFVLTLVPIAVAYHFAHYFSLLIDGGQFIIPLASDPFGFNWDLFGTAAYEINIGVLSPYFYWYASAAAIVLGHIIAVYLAHVVALRTFGDRRSALVSQVPMVALMVAYTMVSLWILAQPIVGK